MSKYNIANIYKEVIKQLEYYYEDGSSRIIEMVIDDFNDWVYGDYELTRLALLAIYDFTKGKDIIIPNLLRLQWKEFKIG